MKPAGYNNIKLNNNLDETELWLSLLASTDIPKNGAELVFNLYPELKRGMDAVKARESSQLTEYDGKIIPQNDLDPRENKKNVISCSRIETAQMSVQLLF